MWPTAVTSPRKSQPQEREKKMKNGYNVDVLLDSARNFCDCEQLYCGHSRRLSAAKKSGEYWDCREGWNRDNHAYYVSANDAWEQLVNMCKLVSADVQKVVACYKSIRRNTQYRRNWESEPHMYKSWSYYGEDYEPGSYESFIRFCHAE